MLIEYFPLLLLALAVFCFVFVTLVATHFLGPKKATSHKLEAFECGIPSQGNARTPFSVSYFLVAILFVLFDVEIIFLYPWAVNFRELGWTGFAEVLVFTAVLMACFAYIWGKDVLNFKNES